MYIAHKCPNCSHDIVNWLSGDLKCSCGYTEDDATFWRLYNLEGYLRDLEHEIERRFPDHYLRIISNSINLAVGWHVLGRFDDRDMCIESIIRNQKEIVDNFSVCYCDFDQIERKIQSFRNIADKKSEQENWPEQTAQAKANLATINEALKELVPRLKIACG